VKAGTLWELGIIGRGEGEWKRLKGMNIIKVLYIHV
jgi:hypothetical protein